MRALDVSREARRFAQELSGLLNCSVTTGLRVGVADAGDLAAVGVGVSASRMGEHVAFPLAPGLQGQQLFMVVWFMLEPDDERTYLRVQTSVVELRTDQDDKRSLLLHIDYERDKDGYPESHLQVEASSAMWKQASPDRHLGRLHLPVGGRRYRPTLEDVVEFVINEGMSTGHDGWRNVVDERRADFHRTQLRAAVRRDPETARQALEEVDSTAAKKRGRN